MKKFLSANKEYFITAAIVLVCVVAGIAIYHLAVKESVDSAKAKMSAIKGDATKTIAVEVSQEAA